MVGEGDVLCADSGGGGEGDDTAVRHSLEKDLAKKSAKQRRRPSQEVRRNRLGYIQDDHGMVTTYIVYAWSIHTVLSAVDVRRILCAMT